MLLAHIVYLYTAQGTVCQRARYGLSRIVCVDMYLYHVVVSYKNQRVAYGLKKALQLPLLGFCNRLVQNYDKLRTVSKLYLSLGLLRYLHNRRYRGCILYLIVRDLPGERVIGAA